MNAGYFRSAEIRKSGFHISFDIVGMGALVGDDQKSFTAAAPAGYSPGTFKTATIFGERGTTVTHQTVPGASYKVSDGVFNTSIMPLGVPQLTIGSVYGTDAVVRFVPIPEIEDDVPDVMLWAVGARHSLSQYFPTSPVDVAAGIFYSKFRVGDLIDFSGISIGAHASKRFSVLTLYGGLAWEKSSANLSYTHNDPTDPVSVNIDLDGANTFRALAGFQLTLGPFHLFADANVGAVTHFSGGFGFGN
jgi:hypothetical protein